MKIDIGKYNKDQNKYDRLVQNIYNKYFSDPLELHKNLIEYRLEKLEEMTENRPFSIDQIIAYLVKLILVEDWNQLNESKGKEIVNSLV